MTIKNLISSLPFNIVLEVLANAVKQEKLIIIKKKYEKGKD